MNKFVLTTIFSVVFLFLISEVSSLSAPPACEVIEKPVDLNVVCWYNQFILVDDNVSSFNFLEKPFASVSQEALDESLKLALILKERQNLKGTLVPLPAKAYGLLPDQGTYLIRINDLYNVKVLYGRDPFPYAIFAILVFLLGIASILIGVILKIKKKDPVANQWLWIGIAIILFFVFSMFLEAWLT